MSQAATEQEQTSSKLSTNENNLKIYPNPTDNSFSLLYKSTAEVEIHYFIKDLLGKEIASGSMNSNNAKQIDSRQFTNGIYFVTLIQNNSLLENQKLIIMK